MQQDQQILDKCIQFLNSIGISIAFRKIENGSFLPGLLIEQGCIVIDKDALLYPGDILHEAGHIAVVPADRRSLLGKEAIIESKERETEEMMAIAWSYAACIYLQIDPHIVFHEQGYKGSGKSIVENFQAGHFFGTPMLQWCKMTIEPRNAQPGESAYPQMLKWLRD
ncbi:hypothetical protein [Niastella sp. OAS944]|uniref:hypothetical protein n=1 Tax=Niastella sp. OAS944 TaxID=2664089 RepID=UPI00349A95FF|nr:hypothetical protein [Chitinophagaceae bacterium OAS944]